MITYTRAEKEGKPATYDCGLCGHFAEDVDGAREHQAVHVAGPDLLAAMKDVRGIATYEQGIENADPTDMQEDLEGILEAAEAAIAKAEPEPKPAGCPPGCGGCGCASTPHPPCGHCESHQTPEGA